MFIATLFTVATIWKPTKFTITDDCVKKLYYIYTKEYNSALRGK